MKRQTKASLRAVCIFTVIVCIFYTHWPERSLPANVIANEIIVEKGIRKLSLYQNRTLLKSYRVSLGGHSSGPKTQFGDQRTPEGNYRIDYRNSRSQFHLALHISYPNAADIAQAAAQGVTAGGDVMIHGIRKGLGWIGRAHRIIDWTDGCIAVTNLEMEEIWRAVPDGTAIIIKP